MLSSFFIINKFLFLKNISGILSISFPAEKISHSEILTINLEFELPLCCCHNLRALIEYLTVLNYLQHYN